MSYYTRVSGHFKAGYDSSSKDFFNVAGITDTTQKDAINQLVLSYKLYGIWSKMSAIYPLVGGDATKHSYNLKNPGLYQITWTGPLTHNSNGVTGGGGYYGDTGLNANSVLSLNDAHISMYVRGNSAGDYLFDMGVHESGSNHLTMSIQYGNLTSFVFNNSGRSDSVGTSGGSFTASRTDSTTMSHYKNTSGLSNAIRTSTSKPNYNIFLLATNDAGSPSAYISTRNYAMFTIGNGLNFTEIINKYTADQAFQTALGRNV